MKYQNFLKAQAALIPRLGFFVSTTYSLTVPHSPKAEGKTSYKWRPNHDFMLKYERGETAVLGGNI